MEIHKNQESSKTKPNMKNIYPNKIQEKELKQKKKGKNQKKIKKNKKKKKKKNNKIIQN